MRRVAQRAVTAGLEQKPLAGEKIPGSAGQTPDWADTWPPGGRAEAPQEVRVTHFLPGGEDADGGRRPEAPPPPGGANSTSGS